MRSIKIEARPVRSEVVSFRLSTAEMDALETGLAATGENLSTFMRRAITARLAGPTITITGEARGLDTTERVRIIRDSHEQ